MLFRAGRIRQLHSIWLKPLHNSWSSVNQNIQSTFQAHFVDTMHFLDSYSGLSKPTGSAACLKYFYAIIVMMGLGVLRWFGTLSWPRMAGMMHSSLFCGVYIEYNGKLVWSFYKHCNNVVFRHVIVIIILHISVSVVCMFIWQTHVGFGLVVLPVNHELSNYGAHTYPDLCVWRNRVLRSAYTDISPEISIWTKTCSCFWTHLIVTIQQNQG